MDDTTKFNLTAHKALWNWLADNPNADKFEWPGWRSNGGEYSENFTQCFACAYAGIHSVKHERFEVCCYCPFILHNPGTRCLDGLFADWEIAGRFNKEYERTVLAHQIANLPIKEGVETI